MSVIRSLQELTLSYPNFLLEPPHQEVIVEMDTMIYKFHPGNQEKSKGAAEVDPGFVVDPEYPNTNKTWSIGIYSDLFVDPGYTTTGGSRLPAAKNCLFGWINIPMIIIGGDKPITGFKQLFEKIRKETEHYQDYDNVTETAGKTITRKNIMNYLRCVPRLSPAKWGQDGVWGQVDNYTPLEVPSRGSLSKILCKNG